MDHITLTHDEALLLDVTALQTALEQVPDQRKQRGKQFPLSLLLTLILMAKLVGKQKPSHIAKWLKLRTTLLVKLFQFERDKMPSINTIRRTLQKTCSPEQLHERLSQFLHETHGGGQSVLIAIDGKTLRGTIPKGKTRGVHLMAAYMPEEGIVLMQIRVDKKENEISAAPRILEAIHLKGKIVCGDAMLTQRKLSVQVIQEGGDYIWFIKENQPTLLEDVARFFEPPAPRPDWQPTPQPLPQQQVHTVNTGHGRLEERTLTVIEDTTGYLDWPGVERVFKIERKATCATCGKVREEVTFGITSTTTDQTPPAQLADHIRAYWGIENGLHHRRDVTLHEDATRMSDDKNNKMAEVMATLNNFIVGLTQKLGLNNLSDALGIFDASVTMSFVNMT